jgi:hypothetical protein
LDDEPVLVRKERQVGQYNFNSLPQRIAFFLSNILVIPSTNSAVSNSSTLVLTDQFWLTLFSVLQYFTFFAWFALLFCSYVGGVAVLYLFSIVQTPYGSNHGVGGGATNPYYASSSLYSGNPVGGSASSYSSASGYSSGLFRSFEDENMPLFDKVTSVGYGFLDRGSELASLIQTPECLRYAMCHMSSTLGDQEANGYVFKDLLRSISSQLDNKAGAEGMTRSVNVGLLTGECDEPIMSCPELAPYFKKVADTWSNYL